VTGHQMMRPNINNLSETIMGPDAIDELIKAIALAEDNDLLYQFLCDFVWDLSEANEKQIRDSIWYAKREWDL